MARLGRMKASATGSSISILSLSRTRSGTVRCPLSATPWWAPLVCRTDARERHPDRIGVVTMRGESPAVEMGLQTFEPQGARPDPDAIAAARRRVRCAFAQPFKTARAARQYRHFPSGHRTGIPMSSQVVVLPVIWRPALALIWASVVIMGSPGPSTMSVTAVGAAYGFRRSLKYACGLIVGTTAVLLAVAIGIVTIVLSIPHAAPILVAVSAVYLLFLAFRIATAPPLADRRGKLPAPAFAGGFLLAIANPKAYLAIAAVFAGTSIFGEDRAFDAAVKAALLSAMIVIIHMCWLSAGASLSRVLQDPTGSRVVNVSLATSMVVVTLFALLG